MSAFKRLDEITAIIRNKGTYKEVPVYEYNKDHYIKHGSGYAKCIGKNPNGIGGLTSVSGVTVITFILRE